MRLAGLGEAPYHITAGGEADLAAAEEEIARGDLATDMEVQAVFAPRGM